MRVVLLMQITFNVNSTNSTVIVSSCLQVVNMRIFPVSTIVRFGFKVSQDVT